MTDKEIVDALAKALKTCEPVKLDWRYVYSSAAVEVADGFWRGVLTGFLKERESNKEK